MKKAAVLFIVLMMTGYEIVCDAQEKWISMFNGEDLSGWFVHGKAQWSVQNGILTGEGGMGHTMACPKRNL